MAFVESQLHRAGAVSCSVHQYITGPDLCRAAGPSMGDAPTAPRWRKIRDGGARRAEAQAPRWKNKTKVAVISAPADADANSGEPSDGFIVDRALATIYDTFGIAETRQRGE